jgi:hypothetical protein
VAIIILILYFLCFACCSGASSGDCFSFSGTGAGAGAGGAAISLFSWSTKGYIAFAVTIKIHNSIKKMHHSAQDLVPRGCDF